MPKLFSKVLSVDEIEALENAICEEAAVGEDASAWKKLQMLRKAQQHQREAAISLLNISEQGIFDPADMADLLAEIVEAHGEEPEILSLMGQCLEAIRDIDDLNSAPPEHAVFETVVDRLSAMADTHQGRPGEEAILHGLSTAARMVARQRGAIAEDSYRKLAELNPNDATQHYNLGLFYKTRGRFDEGLAANRLAVELADEPHEAHAWNLGICATGAGAGAEALEVWQRLGNKLQLGRFGLPDGSYPQCKVKLAERPLAERDAQHDDPGLEETIWIERLSPCHGIIRSVLYNDLGVNYGDVVLIDGAPITYHTYGDIEVPVFPHLATLMRRNFQIYAFAGTQESARQLADVSVALDADAVVYAHSENYRELCANCWRDPDLDHEHHQVMEKHVVVGRIAAPKETDPEQLLAQIDAAVAAQAPCRLYAPDLCRAAGFEARADVDNRRFELLIHN